MKKWMIEHLICPECLSKDPDKEIQLTVNIQTESDDDIIEGQLVCPDCSRCYQIHEGIAVVVPERTQPITQRTSGYGSFSMRSSYMWSHYSEFFDGTDIAETNATNAYKKWAAAFTPRAGWALDIGCSVGRLTFELTKTHDRAVGVDTSFSFIQTARNLASQKRLAFDLIMEGQITETRSGVLDPDFDLDKAEFIVADAMALPFRSHGFASANSVNVLEKVPDPGLHLSEANRIMDRKDARFLFSDPFSWDETVSHPDLWLGGKNEGPFKGFGINNICRMLQGNSGIFSPGFSIKETGQVLWKIRKTRNLWEYITSQFVIAHRGQA